jgi:hypothetical protein
MSKEQLSLAELHELLRELEAVEQLYKTNKIVFYKPLPKGDQRKFFDRQTDSVRLVLGSNRSGKTVCGAVEAIAHSLGYRPWLPEDHPLRIVRLPNGQPIPVPNVGRILAQNYRQAVQQTIWPKFEEWAPLHMIKKVVRNAQGIVTEIIWNNDSIIHLMSDDQDDLAFEGPAGHWAWIDEPCGYRKYTGLKRGLVDNHGHLWFTMTPLGAFWINEMIVDRANEPGSGVSLFKYSIWDNCVDNGGYLDRAAIEEFLRICVRMNWKPVCTVTSSSWLAGSTRNGSPARRTGSTRTIYLSRGPASGSLIPIRGSRLRLCGWRSARTTKCSSTGNCMIPA